MNMNNSLLDNVPDIQEQFRHVATSLHEIANHIDTFGQSPNPLSIEAISDELKQIGWSTLFVCTSIDSLVSLSMPSSMYPDTQDQTDQLSQIHTLRIAAEYLARNIRYFKARNARANQVSPEIKQAFQRLGNKLQEVADECQYA